MTAKNIKRDNNTVIKYYKFSIPKIDPSTKHIWIVNKSHMIILRFL